VREQSINKIRRIAAYLLVIAAFVIFIRSTSAQPLYNNPSQKTTVADDDPRSYVQDMDDLMHARLERERTNNRNTKLVPEILRVEGNYIRTDAPTGEVVLYESSFHLEPRYLSFSAMGREAGDSTPAAPQSVMYFTGIARTPLALPLVSNLSKVLSGDEASYSIYLGILPLPQPIDHPSDSLHFYCIIERAIQSNRSESEVRLERYSKEFAFKVGEPIQLRLENTPPDRQTYIIKIEDNSEPLNFYEDFARHFREHIILNGERLLFDLKKANLSMISPRVSIPYTVGQMAHVKLDLLSVVDEAHPRTLVDSVMRPADYIAECDIKDLINGTYRYRITAKEIGTGKVLYTDTKEFEKKQPLMVGNGINLAGSNDTLEVGGKKASSEKQLQALNSALVLEKVRTERLEATNSLLASENKDMKTVLDAQKGDIIAGIRGRSGMGFGKSTGINLFIGAESMSPALTIDASFGLLYSSSVPYLDYEAPQNFSQIFKSPKSIGLQIGWAPMSLLGGILSPVVRLGYYGIFSQETPSTAGGRHSATLIEPALGITSTPGGAGTNFGFDFTVGPSFGLGINEPAELDVQAKFYLRF
jgi:hypothetical protein